MSVSDIYPFHVDIEKGIHFRTTNQLIAISTKHDVIIEISKIKMGPFINVTNALKIILLSIKKDDQVFLRLTGVSKERMNLAFEEIHNLS